MKQLPKFFIYIPVKPYVKRFIETNYGTPVDFTSDPPTNQKFLQFLSKPCTERDNQYPTNLSRYATEVEIAISDKYFFKYGCELTKTDIVSFNQLFAARAKVLMRSIVGSYHAIGLPYNNAIRKFQERFGFSEDDWAFEAIKKDYYRNGVNQELDFEGEIFQKIEKIILLNLYDLGTICKPLINKYENN